jgi:hypothetical protein
MYLNDSLRQFALPIALLLCGLSAATATSADSDEPLVKLSRNHVCHERGDPYYSSTIHFQAFNTLADCVRAGGRILHGHSGKGRGSQADRDAPADLNAAPVTPEMGPLDFKLRSLMSRYSSGLMLLAGFGVAIVSFLLLWSAYFRHRGRAGKPLTVSDRAHERLHRRAASDESLAVHDRTSERLRQSGPTANPLAVRNCAPELAPPSSARVRTVSAGAAEERELVTACLGDRDTAERLIQYEIDKNSALSWGAAAAAALARLKRDNH